MDPQPSSRALEQLRLRYRLAAAAADTYVEAGFRVVLEDVVAGHLLREWRSLIRSRPCHVIVLLPSLDAVAAREAGRTTRGYGRWTLQALHETFAVGTAKVGIWLDTTDLTPEQTVEQIIARTSCAQPRERSAG